MAGPSENSTQCLRILMMQAPRAGMLSSALVYLLITLVHSSVNYRCMNMGIMGGNHERGCHSAVSQKLITSGK